MNARTAIFLILVGELGVLLVICLARIPVGGVA